MKAILSLLFIVGFLVVLIGAAWCLDCAARRNARKGVRRG